MSAPPPTDPLDVAWQRVLQAWDDDRAHRAFMNLGLTLDRLPDVGRLYREARDKNATHAERATKQLAQLVVIATERLRATATPRDASNRRWIQVAAAILTLAMIAFAFMHLRRIIGP